MCEITWYRPRVGANREGSNKSDVKFSLGRKKEGFNLTFSKEACKKVAPSGKIDIGIVGSRMFFRDNGLYSLGSGGHSTEKRYLKVELNTDFGRDGVAWIKEYGKSFTLLKDEKTGLYCIDANGNTTKED